MASSSEEAGSSSSSFESSSFSFNNSNPESSDISSLPAYVGVLAAAGGLAAFVGVGYIVLYTAGVKTLFVGGGIAAGAVAGGGGAAVPAADPAADADEAVQMVAMRRNV
jgi:hypothetical protein